MNKEIKVGNICIGGGKGLVLIAGPCVIESEAMCLEAAKRIKDIAGKLKVPFIFKSSYDKANRLSVDSFRGPGLQKGLEILRKVKEKVGVPVLSDVHSEYEVEEASRVLDIIQIPALLCRQTDLLLRAASTGLPVNIKKGQFLAPWDMFSLIEKAESAGNKKIIITERGSAFGYNNLVVDFRSLQIMRKARYPVIFDATHSVQLPGAGGKRSGGQREFVRGLCRAAVACGLEGLFLEVHARPDKAACDGPNMIPLNELKIILQEAQQIERALR